MKTRVAAIIVLLGLAAGINAEGVTVSYVDGSVSVRRGGTWVELAAGDSVPADARVRLADAAHLELDARGVKVVLTRAGTYSLASVLSTRHAMDAAGVGTSLQAALA